MPIVYLQAGLATHRRGVHSGPFVLSDFVVPSGVAGFIETLDSLPVACTGDALG
jgi:hypothetical protein